MLFTGVLERSDMKIKSFGSEKIRMTVLSGLFLTMAACTVYTPIHGAATPGYDVRVRLTDKGAADLVPRIGPRARELQGTLRNVSDTSMVVLVRKVVREGGGEDTYEGLEVSIPSADIELAETSKTSVSRSMLAAGGILASALLIAKGAGDIGGGGSSRPPPTGR
jgi:hypothetical protein